MRRRAICLLFSVARFVVPCHFLVTRAFFRNGGRSIKPGSRCFVVAAEQVPPEFSRMTVAQQIRRAKSMSWDPVYRLVKQIPRGRVLSYGALAKALHLRGGARSAGRAMAATPSGKGIPWHRVVGERGKILIREPYASLQKKLLESEGVKVIESRVELNIHLWTPSGKSHQRKKPSSSRGNPTKAKR